MLCDLRALNHPTKGQEQSPTIHNASLQKPSTNHNYKRNHDSSRLIRLPSLKPTTVATAIIRRSATTPHYKNTSTLEQSLMPI
jgi:hypothetical protein